MSQFVVRSNDSSDHLTLWSVMPRDEWRARIECDGLTAEAKVYERYSGDALRLDSFFGDLAAQWRGWDGDKEWESLGLRLAARHDRLGHIALDAILRESYALANRWQVRASFTLDAGGLDRLAREARALDG
jgi:hypothetical protein